MIYHQYIYHSQSLLSALNVTGIEVVTTPSQAALEAEAVDSSTSYEEATVRFNMKMTCAAYLNGENLVFANLTIDDNEIYGATIAPVNFTEFNYTWSSGSEYQLDTLYDFPESQVYQVDEEIYVGFGRNNKTLVREGNLITTDILTRFLKSVGTATFKSEGAIPSNNESSVSLDFGNKVNFASFSILKTFTAAAFSSYVQSAEQNNCTFEQLSPAVIQEPLTDDNLYRLMNAFNTDGNDFALVTVDGFETVAQCEEDKRYFSNECHSCEELLAEADRRCKSPLLQLRLSLPYDYPDSCGPYVCTMAPTLSPTATPTYAPTPLMDDTFCKKCSDLSVESCEDGNTGLNCAVDNGTCTQAPDMYAACQNRFTKVHCDSRHTYYHMSGMHRGKVYNNKKPKPIGRRGVEACEWNDCEEKCEDKNSRAQFALKDVRIQCSYPADNNDGIRSSCELKKKKSANYTAYFDALLTKATFIVTFKSAPVMSLSRDRNVVQNFQRSVKEERSASSSSELCDAAVDITSNALPYGGGVQSCAGLNKYTGERFLKMSPLEFGWRMGSWRKATNAYGIKNNKAWMTTFWRMQRNKQKKYKQDSTLQETMNALRAKLNGIVMKEQVKSSCQLQSEMGCRWIPGAGECFDFRCNDQGGIVWPQTP